MSERIPKSVRDALAERQAMNALRTVAPLSGIDLCSNDYLGASRYLATLHPNLEEAREEGRIGATGSRLISGTAQPHLRLEEKLAAFHQTEAALLLGSGYEANVGLLGSLGSRHDTILYDELVHASMRDGIRLSVARSFSFRHNDLEDLEKKLKAARGECYIAVESVYSMDGDIAPLRELVEVCERHGAHLIVDEAHGTGVFGERGEGVTQSLGLQRRVFARTHTFGKAVGYRGAVIVGSKELREYLINFARPFVYSTAFDLVSLWYIERAYEFIAGASGPRSELRALISEYHMHAARLTAHKALRSQSPIQGIVVPSNSGVLAVERALVEAGVSAKAIRSPTVPEGSERIRICLHSFNTSSELALLFSAIEPAYANGVING